MAQKIGPLSDAQKKETLAIVTIKNADDGLKETNLYLLPMRKSPQIVFINQQRKFCVPYQYPSSALQNPSFSQWQICRSIQRIHEGQVVSRYFYASRFYF